MLAAALTLAVGLLFKLSISQRRLDRLALVESAFRVGWTRYAPGT